MKILHDFKCHKCGIFEKLVDSSQSSVTCKCGSTANKVVSAARYLGNTVGKFPTIK